MDRAPDNLKESQSSFSRGVGADLHVMNIAIWPIPPSQSSFSRGVGADRIA